MKKYIIAALLTCTLFSMRKQKLHTASACYETVSEMRQRKNEMEASLCDKLIESVSEYDRQDCAECFPQHCYEIKYLD